MGCEWQSSLQGCGLFDFLALDLSAWFLRIRGRLWFTMATGFSSHACLVLDNSSSFQIGHHGRTTTSVLSRSALFLLQLTGESKLDNVK